MTQVLTKVNTFVDFVVYITANSRGSAVAHSFLPADSFRVLAQSYESSHLENCTRLAGALMLGGAS